MGENADDKMIEEGDQSADGGRRSSAIERYMNTLQASVERFGMVGRRKDSGHKNASTSSSGPTITLGPVSPEFLRHPCLVGYSMNLSPSNLTCLIPARRRFFQNHFDGSTNFHYLQSSNYLTFFPYFTVYKPDFLRKGYANPSPVDAQCRRHPPPSTCS